MLKVEELTGGYGSSKVLFGMAFEASEGEVISLIGRNGMGKTTTVKTLMGMLPATGGSVTFRGRVLGARRPARWRVWAWAWCRRGGACSVR